LSFGGVHWGLSLRPSAVPRYCRPQSVGLTQSWACLPTQQASARVMASSSIEDLTSLPATLHPRRLVLTTASPFLPNGTPLATLQPHFGCSDPLCRPVLVNESTTAVALWFGRCIRFVKSLSEGTRCKHVALCALKSVHSRMHAASCVTRMPETAICHRAAHAAMQQRTLNCAAANGIGVFSYVSPISTPPLFHLLTSRRFQSEAPCDPDPGSHTATTLSQEPARLALFPDMRTAPPAAVPLHQLRARPHRIAVLLHRLRSEPHRIAAPLHRLRAKPHRCASCGHRTAAPAAETAPHRTACCCHACTAGTACASASSGPAMQSRALCWLCRDRHVHGY